jgi:large subunit ribosomal protein L4
MMTHPQFLEVAKTRYLLALLHKLRWTKTSGGVMFVTGKERKNLVRAARRIGEHVVVKRVKDLKVRDLLLKGRIVVERRALEWLIARFGVDRVAPPQMDKMKEYQRLLNLLKV